MLARRIVLAALTALALAACERHDAGASATNATGATPPGQPASAYHPTAEVQAFLTRNGQTAGVVTLPSGLQYQIVHSGPASGLRPQGADEVKINYEGSLTTGQVFDSSFERGRPEAMPLVGLVPGFSQALMLMRPGDEWRVWIPPQLGYGGQGAGPIPPGSVLVFRIQLLDVLPDPSRIGRG